MVVIKIYFTIRILNVTLNPRLTYKLGSTKLTKVTKLAKSTKSVELKPIDKIFYKKIVVKIK